MDFLWLVSISSPVIDRDLFTNDQPQSVGLDYKYSQWDMPGSPLLLSLAAGQPTYGASACDVVCWNRFECYPKESD